MSVVILDTPPSTLAARVFDLSSGDVEIESTGKVIIATANPVTATYGANQVIASWYDTLARPRGISVTGFLKLSGYGPVAVWNARSVTGTSYTPPPMSNYSSSAWSIATGSNTIVANTVATPNIVISDGTPGGTTTLSNGVVQASDVQTSTFACGPVGITASGVVSGVASATIGVGGLVVNGPITNSSGAVNIQDTLSVLNLCTLQGGLTVTGNPVTFNGAGSNFTVNKPAIFTSGLSSSTAIAASITGSAATAVSLTGGAVAPPGYLPVDTLGIAWDGAGNAVLMFSSTGNNYYIGPFGYTAF